MQRCKKVKNIKKRKEIMMKKWKISKINKIKIILRE